MTLGETMHKIRLMVDEFIREHQWEWEKVREAYKQKTKEEYQKFYKSDFEGFSLGRSLSFQSHVGTDLLIDFVFLALESEKKQPFVREYWIRSHGTQCIKNDEDARINRDIFHDILGKIRVKFDGEEFTDVSWFEDEDCLLINKFIKNGNHR